MPAVPAPWLNPPDYTGAYLHGAQIGATAAEARARLQAAVIQNQQEHAIAQQRLQQQAAEAQMENETRQRLADQKAREEEQRLKIQGEYQKAQIGLAAQKLQESQQMNDFKIKQAAQTFQAQGQYQSDYQSLLDQGVPEGEASIKAALRNPGFLKGGSGLAAVARAQQATVPKDLEIRTEGDKQFFRSAPTEAYKVVPGGGEDRVMSHAAYTSGLTGVREMERDFRVIPTGNKKEKSEAAKEIESEKRRLNSIAESKKAPVPFPNVRAEALPLPKTQAELVVGELYQTKRGPARWDGEQFIPE